MFVCVCNAIRECEFRRVAMRSSGDATCIYAAMGKRPNCGHCLEDAEEVLFEVRELASRSRLAA